MLAGAPRDGCGGGVTVGLFGAGAGLEERPPLPPRDRGILVLNVAYKNEYFGFDEDSEMTEKSMVDVKLKRRGINKAGIEILH